MTEKRFILQNQEQHLNLIYDKEKNKIVFNEDVINLLNKLQEEKEKWKQQCLHFKKMLEDMDIDYIVDEELE